MASASGNSRVTNQQLYAEVTPIREDIAEVKIQVAEVRAQVKLLVWGVGLILTSILGAAVTLVAQKTPPALARSALDALLALLRSL